MILTTMILVLFSQPAAAAAPEYNLEQILDAIRCVETGGSPNAGRDSDGDGGRAIGPFQIHRPYWIDSGVPGQYEDCRDREYARRVVLAYWRRYCPEALNDLDAEVLARTHNGGPTGAKRDNTIRYWNRVRQELSRSSRVRSAIAEAPFSWGAIDDLVREARRAWIARAHDAAPTSSRLSMSFAHG